MFLPVEDEEKQDTPNKVAKAMRREDDVDVAHGVEIQIVLLYSRDEERIGDFFVCLRERRACLFVLTEDVIK